MFERLEWSHDFPIRISLGIIFAAIFVSHIDLGAASFSVDGNSYRILADDSMITLRVANNFATRGVPYFNVDDRLAANTSLFWPIILSPLFNWFSLKNVILIVSVLSLCVTIASVLLVLLGSKNILSALASSAVLFVSLPLQHYAISAWEPIPQMFFVTAGFLVILGRFGRNDEVNYCLGFALLCIAFLLRNDTFVLIGPVGAYMALKFIRKPNKIYVFAFIFGLSCLIAQIVLHLQYYGDILPNTYYLKQVGGAQDVASGIKYAISSAPTVLVFIIALVLAWLFFPGNTRTNERVVIVCGVSLTAYIVYVGGDVFPHARFFLPFVPIAILLFTEKMLELSAWGKPQRAFSTVAFSLALVSTLSAFTLNNFLVRTNGDQIRRAYGSGDVLGVGAEPRQAQVALIPIIKKAVSPQDGDIGLFYLGALSYYLPEFRFTDFLGKADAHIARLPVKWGPPGHNKWDFNYSLTNRSVSLIPFPLIESSSEPNTGKDRRVDYGFWNEFPQNPIIKESYIYISASELCRNSGWGIYVRKDLQHKFDDIISDCHRSSKTSDSNGRQLTIRE